MIINSILNIIIKKLNIYLNFWISLTLSLKDFEFESKQRSDRIKIKCSSRHNPKEIKSSHRSQDTFASATATGVRFAEWYRSANRYGDSPAAVRSSFFLQTRTSQNLSPGQKKLSPGQILERTNPPCFFDTPICPLAEGLRYQNRKCKVACLSDIVCSYSKQYRL